jgi:hypothetical protein
VLTHGVVEARILDHRTEPALDLRRQAKKARKVSLFRKSDDHPISLPCPALAASTPAVPLRNARQCLALVATIAAVMSAALRHALTDPGEPPLRPLSNQLNELLESLNAPPRLAAHLRAVHDVAWHLTQALAARFPRLTFDREAVLFGAATHDIGKTVHMGELSGPGSAHEQTGYGLLLRHGVDDTLARFARTHASWHLPDIAIDDLLVSVADKVWKGNRVIDLEQLVVDRIAAVTGREPWRAFMELDDILGRLAAGADDRLRLQASHAIHRSEAGR